MKLYAPIRKSDIDIARRTVTGIAQVEDEPDHQGDVVDFDASRRAFAKWTGNVREMHAKKAVGRCLDWRADSLRKAIAVTLKISEGAEDTWQKVLDGTLNALSIGGHTIAATRSFHKSTGRTYNRITDYALTELSLVDSPANAHCVITAIHKSLVATKVLAPIRKEGTAHDPSSGQFTSGSGKSYTRKDSTNKRTGKKITHLHDENGKHVAGALSNLHAAADPKYKHTGYGNHFVGTGGADSETGHKSHEAALKWGAAKYEQNKAKNEAYLDKNPHVRQAEAEGEKLAATRRQAWNTEKAASIQGGIMKTRKAHAAIRGIAKTLGDDDELILIKKSDIETGRSDGLFVLRKTATPGVITKDDADDGGFTSDADQVDPGDLGGIDLEDHATNMANAHKDLCSMSGIDDHVGHYEDATKGDDDMQDDNGDGVPDDDSSAPSDLAMSRRTGNLRKYGRRNRRSTADVNKLIERAVGNALAPIAKALDELRANGNGGGNAPRKGGEGAPIVKTIGDHLGATPGATNGAGDGSGLAGRYEELMKSHETLNARAQTIISKTNAGHRLTTEEDVERVSLGRQLGLIEVEMGELKRSAAGV